MTVEALEANPPPLYTPHGVEEGVLGGAVNGQPFNSPLLLHPIVFKAKIGDGGYLGYRLLGALAKPCPVNQSLLF